MILHSERIILLSMFYKAYLNVYYFYYSVSILNVNEKLPASKFQYFGKYKIQLFGYCYVHVSGQRQTGLKR